MVDEPSRRRQRGTEGVKKFHRSLVRCTTGGGFGKAFYRRLYASSAEVTAHFDGLDMERQERLLESALYICLQFAQQDTRAEKFVAYLKEKHAGFPDQYYTVWLETLLATVAAFDKQFDEEIEQAWRFVLEPVIERLSAAGPE